MSPAEAHRTDEAVAVDAPTGAGTAPRSPLHRVAGRLPGRTWATAGAVLLVLLTVLVWFTRPAGLVQGEQTQTVVVTTPSVPVEPGHEVVQEVTASQDDLAAVSVSFATYLGATDCAVDVSLTGPDGDLVAEQRTDCVDLVDTVMTSRVLDFDAIEDSAGQTYTVRITSAPGDWDQAVSVWLGEPKSDEEPAVVDGEESDLTALVVAEYEAPPVPQQVLTAFERSAVGHTWWVQPPAMIAWALLLAAALVLAVHSSFRSMRVATWCVIAVALLRGLLWAGVMPPLEGMDEGAHVGYAQFMAEEQRIPVRGQAHDGLYRTLSPQMEVLDEYQNRGATPPSDRPDHSAEAKEELARELAAASPRANGSSSASGYPPTYYLPAAVMYELTPGTLDDKVLGMRLVSVLLGALAAWPTVLIARRLLPGLRTPAVLLALAVTLQPMVAHQFSIVNNDALVIAAGFGALAAALRLAAGRVRARDVLVGGLMVGAALLAKPFGAAAAVVVGLGWLIGLRRDRARPRTWLAHVGAGVAGVAVTYGVWVLTQRLGGFPSTQLPVSGGGDLDRSPSHYLALQFQQGLLSFRGKWAEQLFGRFSWLDIVLPEGAYDAIWTGLVVLLWLAGAWLLVGAVRRVVALVRRGRGTAADRTGPAGATPADALTSDAPASDAHGAGAHGAGPGVRPLVDGEGPFPDGTPLPDGTVASGNAVRVWMCAAYVLGALGVLYLAGYLYFRSSGIDDLLQGRYLLMTLPALLALPALLIEGLVPARLVRWRRVVLWVVPALLLAAMWALQVVALVSVGDRFYL